MNAELVLPYDAPREVWLKARTAGIGGSDALACLGLDPWKTRLEVYLDKLGTAPEREQTDRMRWGQIVEAALLEWFTDRTGLKIKRLGLLRSLENGWQLASLDAQAEDGGIVECKNTGWHRRGEWADGQVADGAEAQSQHYLDVTGASHAWAVAQIGGEPPIIRRIERDPELIRHIRAAELEVWRMVQDGTPPAIEGGQASDDLLKRLFPVGKPGGRLIADSELIVRLFEDREAHQAAAIEEATKRAVRNHIKARMGDATELVDRNGRVLATWDNRSKTKVDVPLLRERFPEAAAAVLSETHYRQFTNKTLKD